MTEETVYLGLGSNLGDRETLLCSAIESIRMLAGCEWVHRSSFYETAAWGKTDQPDFLNIVAVIETTLTPRSLLERLHQIERSFGRERRGRWEARTLDIDILLFGEEIIQAPDLIVPHPDLVERRFILVPLNEIAPDLQVPGSDVTVHELLNRCPDQGSVRIYRKSGCHSEEPR